MTYKIILGWLLVTALSCQTKNKPEPVPPPQKDTVLTKLLDSSNKAANKVRESMDRLDHAIELTGKKNQFMEKMIATMKLYNETRDEKYRLRYNRYVDSCNKYIGEIQILAKELNH